MLLILNKAASRGTVAEKEQALGTGRRESHRCR